VQRHDQHAVDHYEGLCRKTAALYVNYVEEEYEDIVQILRVKVWRALETFDSTKWKKEAPGNGPSPVERYVFMCIKNQCKDLVKRKQRGEVYIEDQGALGHDGHLAGRHLTDAFELRYLAADHDQVFGDIEDGVPLIPSTLTDREREIVCLLWSDYRQTEIAAQLGLRRSEVERGVRSIRLKMADWRPSQAQVLAAA